MRVIVLNNTPNRLTMAQFEAAYYGALARARETAAQLSATMAATFKAEAFVDLDVAFGRLHLIQEDPNGVENDSVTGPGLYFERRYAERTGRQYRQFWPIHKLDAFELRAALNAIPTLIQHLMLEWDVADLSRTQRCIDLEYTAGACLALVRALSTPTTQGVIP